MSRHRFRALLIVTHAGTLASACTGGAALRGRLQATYDILAQAERNGAYRCAPRELALAKSHGRFVEVELRQGRLSRANEHYAIAEPNARAAYRMSPPERCAPRAVVVERRPAPRIECVDRDADGLCEDDRCPDQPENYNGYQDDDGCPDDPDTDGDGIADSRDSCPVEPEDADGYLDDDGCPEPDNDLDRVADTSDRCPNDPEDPDGFQDEDGCPDNDNDADTLADVQDQCPNEPGPPDNQGCPRRYVGVIITATQIRISQQIFFEFNRARIRPVSFPILDQVAQVLRDYPTVTVEVQGHTDSVGNDEYNMRLSQSRSESVRTYLIGKGIDAARLTARGYGETQPIESNANAAGRARNRRVVFWRTDAAAQQSQPPQQPPAP